MDGIKVGDRVGIVMSANLAGSWIDGRTGVVVGVRSASRLVDVRVDGDTPLGPEPVRQLDRRHVRILA